MNKPLFMAQYIETDTWLYGSLMIERDEYFIFTADLSVPRSDKLIQGWTFPVKPDSANIFIGHTDSQETDIYEGHVLADAKTGKIIGVVQWMLEHSAYMLLCKTAEGVTYKFIEGDKKLSQYTIVSHIYDMPDILEKDYE